ncbi:MAG: sulfatase, partial [Chitinophagia bacterium]|nr:sulfatase [Chitinophagia bacterium]
MMTTATRLCCILALAASSTMAQSRRPNILFIAVDDLKPVIGAYGGRIAKTPNLDKLASAGTV